MTNSSAEGRTDKVSKTIKAPPNTVYRALIDPDALMAWLPPKGMKGEVHTFEPWPGGAYHVTLTNEDEAHALAGKTRAGADVVSGRFVEVTQDELIVQEFTFESADPAFAGVMTMAWQLMPIPDGTEITIICKNVPAGIGEQDHEIGLRSTLDNLAAYIEQ